MPAPPGCRATAQLNAANDVAAAEAAADQATGPLVEIGLLGTDVASMEADATRAVDGLDLQAATSRARAVEDLVSGATSLGLVRVVISIAIAAAVALLVYRAARRRCSRGMARAALEPVDPLVA